MGFEDFIGHIYEDNSITHYANFKFLWSGHDFDKNIWPDSKSVEEFIKSKFPGADTAIGVHSMAGIDTVPNSTEATSDIMIISKNKPIEKEAYTITYPNLIQVSTWKRRVGVKAYDNKKESRPGKALPCIKKSGVQETVAFRYEVIIPGLNDMDSMKNQRETTAATEKQAVANIISRLARTTTGLKYQGIEVSPKNLGLLISKVKAIVKKTLG